MSRVLLRLLKIAGGVVLVLLIAVVIVLAWVTGTERGSRFALARAQGFLPEGIDLGKASGRLGDRLTLADVHVKLEGLDLTVSRVWLDWSPAALLRGRLDIAEVGADGIVYRALPAPEPEEPAEPFTLPERVELPVDVRVGRVAVTDARLHLAPEAEPEVVRRVVIEGVTFADTRLAVDRMSVDSPRIGADGRLTATAAGEYPVNAELDWQLRIEDQAPIAGATRLDGSLASLELDQQIEPPYNVTLTGTVAGLVDPAATMAVDARLTADDVRLAAIRADLPPATVSLAVTAKGPVDDLNVTAEASGTDPEQRRFAATTEVGVTPDVVVIRSLSLRQPGRDGRLDGAGQIALAEPVVADLSVDWQALQWPLTGEPTVSSPTGRLTLEGPLDDYRFRLDTRVEPAATPPIELAVTGDGDLRSAAVQVGARTGDGRLDGNVQATWDPALAGRAVVELRDFDPAVVAAAWPGNVDLTLEARAEAEGDRMHVVLERLDAGGQLREQALDVSARGRFDTGANQPTVAVDVFSAALGASRLQLQGRVAEQADLTWELESPDLSELVPDAGGRISGSGRVTGPIPRVRVDADLSASGLAYEDYRLAGLDLTADVDLAGDTRSTLELTARDAVIGGGSAAAGEDTPAIDEFRLSLNGTPAGHRLTLALDAPTGRAALTVDGALTDPWTDSRRWDFTVADGTLGYGELPPWQLTRPASGSVAADHVRVEQQCWSPSAADASGDPGEVPADARLCLGAERGAGGLTAKVDLAHLRFAYFAPLLPEGMELTGAADASANLSQRPGETLLADVRLETTAGRVVLPAGVPGDDPAPAIELLPSSLRVDVDRSGARGSAALVTGYGRLELDAETTAALVTPPADAPDAGQPVAPASGDAPVTGRLRLTVPDLSFVSTLVPDVEEMAGRLDGDLGLAGTVAAPALSGSLDLTGGSLFLPATGITIDGLRASLQGRGREGVALTAAAESGDGEISLDGRFSLPGQPMAAELYVVGRDFQVMDNDDGQVQVSPDLTVTADDERLSVTGTVHVPAAELTPGAQAPSAVTVSEDQVLAGPETGDTAAGRDLYAEVRLSLGDEVHFEGFGLTARFDGDVLVNQEPEKPTTATGELDILDGEYRAYGQGLVIERGRIYFAGGPVTEPALDVRAVRRPAEDILVGAHVQGTLEEPTFELFSEPSMTQQEQLAWLVLGRSLEDSPGGEGSALSRAALAMGLKGGDFLAKNIGEQIGVDQIGIETGSGEAGAPSDPSQAALVIGKYLSPKLYVSYGIGLFNPESVLEMQYEISNNWKLITQSSGAATGADIQYTVEVGGN